MQKLNWLYPNFLKKADHYLKINYPHIWRTRVHDFGWFSLVLGNGLAVLLGVLVVGRDNVFSEGGIVQMHLGLAVMLAFVGLFWAMQLLRFKIKFSDSNTMLTTWLIYVLCVGSLGLNLATFTSTIAYRTAYLYSDKEVQADFENFSFAYSNNSYKDARYPYRDRYLIDEYRTDGLLKTMARHGYIYSENDKIYQTQISKINAKVKMLKEAKVFVWQPFLGKYFKNHEKKSMYHDLFTIHWIIGGVLLFFLPSLLFLLSVFGVRNVLISIFSTAVIAGGVIVIVNLFRPFSYYQQEGITTVFAFITFILGMVLIGGRDNLKLWNYIAGVFMLMLGVVFFAFFMTCSENYRHPINALLSMLKILPISLLVSLTIAWTVAKHSDMPVLR